MSETRYYLMPSAVNCTHLFGFFLHIKLFIPFAVLLLVFAAIYILKIYKNPISYLGLFLVTAGGFANIYERIKNGCVSDYFNFFNLFAFNLADVIITLGIVSLVIGVANGKKNNIN